MSALFAWQVTRFPSEATAERIVRAYEVDAPGRGRFLLCIVPDPDGSGLRVPTYSLHETNESVRAAVAAAKAVRR